MSSAELLEVSLAQDYLENSVHPSQAGGKCYEKLQEGAVV